MTLHHLDIALFLFLINLPVGRRRQCPKYLLGRSDSNEKAKPYAVHFHLKSPRRHGTHPRTTFEATAGGWGNEVLEQNIRMIGATIATALMGLLITKFGSYLPKKVRALAASVCWALFYYWVL
jgi:hypothetical protein